MNSSNFCSRAPSIGGSGRHPFLHRIEARRKLGQFRGMLPQFWMLTALLESKVRQCSCRRVGFGDHPRLVLFQLRVHIAGMTNQCSLPLGARYFGRILNTGRRICAASIATRASGAILLILPGRSHISPHSWSGDITTNYGIVATWPAAAVDKCSAAYAARRSEALHWGPRRLCAEELELRGSDVRSALDIATKSMDGVPKLSFFLRLKWLYDNGRITQDIKDWADHVRVEGNEALHDLDDYEQKDAAALQFFTEMFSRYFLSFPARPKPFAKSRRLLNRSTPTPTCPHSTVGQSGIHWVLARGFSCLRALPAAPRPFGRLPRARASQSSHVAPVRRQTQTNNR